MCDDHTTPTLDRRSLLRAGGLAAVGLGALSLGLAGSGAPAAHAATRIHGYAACTCMARSLPMIEDRLRKAGGIVRDLSGLITQGAYSGGVQASAGTHNGGGAIDVHYTTADTDEKILAWRRSGVAMWRRRPWEGPWGEHAHGIWIGCDHVSSGAANQIRAYRDGRNGLANNARDPHPNPGVISWADALRDWEGSGGGLPPEPALPDFPDPGPEIFAGVGKNPHGVILYGISDSDLGKRLAAHGFEESWYGNPVWLLVDFARSIGHIPHGSELVDRLRAAPAKDTYWVDYRQQWEAGMNGGHGSNKQLSIHSVRAIQSGLTKFGHPTLEDGVYGPATKKAVRAWQIRKRGVPSNSPAADGIVKLSDAMYLNFASHPQPGGMRTRHSL